jgi:hypothetical protein
VLIPLASCVLSTGSELACSHVGCFFADVLFESGAPVRTEAKRSQPLPRRGALNIYEFLDLVEQCTVSRNASEQVEHVLSKWTCPQVPTQ